MKSNELLRSFLFACSSLLAISSAHAADGTWTLNSNGDWSNAATGNWSGGTVADGIGSSAYLSNVINANRNITLSGDRTIGNIYAQDTSNNYAIIGASILTLDASSGQSILDVVTGRTLTISTAVTVNDGLEKTGDGQVTFTAPITLGANQTWTNNSNGLLLTGNGTNLIDNGGFDLTIDGSGRMRFGVTNQSNNTLKGSGALIKNGTGVLEIGGDNSQAGEFTGNVTVNAGVLYYGDYPGALGSGNLLITGGAIEGRWNNAFTRAQGIGAGEIQITGGISGLGGGNNMIYNIGAITWGSSTFNPTEFILQTSNASSTGKSTLSSSIDLNGVGRIIRSDQTGGDLANGYGTFSGNITNGGATAGLTKTGVGHHILSGTNTYDGGTTINQGSLLFSKIAAMPDSGNVQVNDGGVVGIRVGGAGNWTTGTSGLGTIGGLLAGDGGAGTSTVGYTGNVGIQLDVAATSTYSGNIGNVGTTLAIYKTGTSSLTLDGNNTYSGGTFLNQGTLIADSATALGSGDITFKSGTLQYTANSAAADFGSQFANSTSAMLLNTNGQNVGLSGIANTNTAGLTKSGGGTLTFSGTNTYTGTTAISAGTFVVDGGTTSIGDLTLASNTSLSVINGGTLNTVGVIGDENFSNLTWSVIGGGATSTWNLGGSNLRNYGYNPVKDNNDMTIDGAGAAASAIVTNIGTLQWGISTSNSDLLVTNGGRLNVNSDVQIGSTYYGEAGINNTITIQGGTANAIMTVGQDFYIGFGDRAAASSNTTTVSAGGQLTITRDMYVGHVNANTASNSANPSTANQLTVTGSGTASMKSLSVGYAQAGNNANANVVEVTNGGTLSTTGGTNYIGRALVAGSTSNSNTMTVSGTGSSWNAGNQTVYVGYTNNATAQSNNNILTVGAGASLTNASSLIVGFGTGTETGNQLVVNGSLTATTVSVSTDNSLSGIGAINGAVTVNGALTPGNSPGQLTFNSSLNLGAVSTTTFELGGTTLGTGYDNITLGGAATALAYGGNLTMVNYLAYDMALSSYVYDLFSLGSVTATGDFSSVTVNGLSLTSSAGDWTTIDGSVSYLFSGSTGDLTVTVIPEPSVALLSGLGLLALFRRRR